jgi:hypothetical protein
MFVVFYFLVVGLITQNSQFMFSTNKLSEPIFKTYGLSRCGGIKKNGYIDAIQKKYCEMMHLNFKFANQLFRHLNSIYS